MAVGYLALQAALTIGWWLALAASTGVRDAFELDDARPEVLDAFLVGDLVVFVGGSALAALALVRRWPWARTAVAVTAGGAAYATLYLVGWVAAGGDGWIGIAPMAAATLTTGTIAVTTERP